ncbi:MAG: hypothetical protein LBK13_10900 [Spirochaetales bacterium]|jgi:hypothetical protein|nr:hypothetical protein [Spirochaetales bacterium]
MNASERFYRTLDKLSGRGLGGTVEAVRGAFVQAAGKVPEELLKALFLHFLDTFNQSGKAETSFVQEAYSLGRYIDLFWMDYSSPSDPFSLEDWQFLRDEVSASAGELDLDILQYIMQQILEHGAM